MSVQTNAVSEPRYGAETIAETGMRRTRPVYWSVRRELWENWWVWGAPVAAAALVVVGTLIGAFRAKGMVLSLDPMKQTQIIGVQCAIVAALIMLSTLLVTVFYCVDALYGERRDRSVLFWRSLPVSDTLTVLTKAGVAMVLMPLITVVVAVVTQWLVVGIDAATLAGHGRGVSVIGQVPLLEIQRGLLYHLVTVHALWYAPIYGWLLLVSAWAKRVPLLWAFLPPLVIALGEKIAFGTSHFGQFIAYRAGHGPAGAVFEMQTGTLMHPMAVATPGQFLVSPGLWGGLFVAGLFLAAAVWLRRYRSAS